MNDQGHDRDMNLLTRLRAKPPHVKQSIAVILTLIIFCVILFIWITSFDARTQSAEIRSTIVSPITGVSSLFESFFSGLKETISTAQLNPTATTTNNTVSATSSFDLSGVVIIDPTASSGKAIISTPTKKK